MITQSTEWWVVLTGVFVAGRSTNMIILIQVRDEDARNLVSGKSGQRNQQSCETFKG